MSLYRERKHWIIRVGNGINFKNSKYPFWGVKRGWGGGTKTIVEKFNKGDVLWFMVSKKFGGKMIGVAEYDKFYDKTDEPLIKINTYTNEEQNWYGPELWDLQIHYENLYNTENQDIKACIHCSANILEYTTFKKQINEDLERHYECFKFYGTIIKFD